MSFLNEFEKKVKNTFSGIFAKLGSKGLSPVDLVQLICNELDEKCEILGDNRKVVPNIFTIKLSENDFDNLEKWGGDEFASDLTDQIRDYATGEDYNFIGSVKVEFILETEFEIGYYEIEAIADRTDDEFERLKPIQSENDCPVQYSRLDEATAENIFEYPTIDICGVKYLLNKEKVLIGRSSKCDIVLNDSKVSRYHLELSFVSGDVIARDVGSTNGIYVEGNHTPKAKLVNGNTILVGSTTIIFHKPSLIADDEIIDSDNEKTVNLSLGELV